MNNENIYVGNRYVPIVDGEWNNSKTYEPLTVVLYQGNSYTSKGYVPAGIEITNSDYWVLSGNYNAQLEPITNDINKLYNFYNLTGQNCHFFGDSLTAASNLDNNYTYAYTNKFKEITNANVFNHAVGGATLSQPQGITNTILAQINSADLSNADYVFIQGGQNDFVQYIRTGFTGSDDSSSIYGGVKKLLTTIYSKIPNKCKIYFISWIPSITYFENTQNSMHQTTRSMYYILNEIFKFYEIPIINVTFNCGINELNASKYISADKVHMTSDGYSRVGEVIARSLSGSSSDISYNTTNVCQVFGGFSLVQKTTKNVGNVRLKPNTYYTATIDLTLSSTLSSECGIFFHYINAGVDNFFGDKIMVSGNYKLSFTFKTGNISNNSIIAVGTSNTPIQNCVVNGLSICEGCLPCYSNIMATQTLIETNELTNGSTIYAANRYGQLILSGILRLNSTVSAGKTIFTLPSGCAPSTKYFAINYFPLFGRANGVTNMVYYDANTNSIKSNSEIATGDYALCFPINAF